MNKYQYNVLCDGGDVVVIFAKDETAAIQEAIEQGYNPCSAEPEVDAIEETNALVRKLFQETGYDTIDRIGKFDLAVIAFLAGQIHQIKEVLK